MKFEFLVALKYLIPRFRQLSVSIISLVSIIVISLVVWLVIVFLSVTDGIEKKWIDELVSLNAPLRITPKEAYYNSYYYQIDQLSEAANYETKTLTEKRFAAVTDPYNPNMDSELPSYFPSPDLKADGSLKDLVKELWESIETLPHKNLAVQEYETAFANLRLSLIRDSKDEAIGHSSSPSTTFLSQVSYVTSIDNSNEKFQKMLLPLRQEDLNLLFSKLCTSCQIIEEADSVETSENNETANQNLKAFFHNATINSLITPRSGWQLPLQLYPIEGQWRGIGLLTNGGIRKIVIPQKSSEINDLKKELEKSHLNTYIGTLSFQNHTPNFIADQDISFPIDKRLNLYLAPQLELPAIFVKESLDSSMNLSSLKFQIKALVQGSLLSGEVSPEHLFLGQVQMKTRFEEEPENIPFWPYLATEHKIPSHQSFGDGILLSKNFQTNGARVGDRGYLSYYNASGSSIQEQRLPIYVSGFYDQGLLPIGSKLIFADPQTIASLRSGVSIADKSLGSGIHLRFADSENANIIKMDLINALEARGLSDYWQVESYSDYDFSKPILQQLKSDKTLFTLIAVIILIVACSNIISMLILLVNDKKREIGILQSMGASSRNIATIFGLCGFITGLTSCLIGTFAAILTLINLQTLVDILSFIQGHDAFQSAFYGSSLPNELSYGSLIFVIIATIVISLLAGVAPAIKASMLKPTQILRGE